MQPTSGVFAWSCWHDVPHMWNPPAQVLQPAPVYPVGQLEEPSVLVDASPWDAASLVVSSAPAPPVAQALALDAHATVTNKAMALRKEALRTPYRLRGRDVPGKRFSAESAGRGR